MRIFHPEIKSCSRGPNTWEADEDGVIELPHDDALDFLARHGFVQAPPSVPKDANMETAEKTLGNLEGVGVEGERGIKVELQETNQEQAQAPSRKRKSSEETQ